MSRLSRSELDDMRAEGLSPAVRRDFADAERAVAAWQHERPELGLVGVLGWVDELRRIFGEPEVDRRAWVGDDFRL